MRTECDSQIETALGEYLLRIDSGEVVDPSQFAAAYPDIAGELVACLETAATVERMAGRSARSAEARDTSISIETLAAGPQALEPSASVRKTIEEAMAAAFDAPRTFGRFEIQRELGQGAMGTVYLAFDTRLQRQVALKFPKFSQHADPNLLERFYREARSAATLRHPNICPVYDADCIDEIHFIAMAYIQGRPLSAFIDRKSPPNPRTAALAVRKIARAVHEAHQHGVVHRDLKPANIVIDDRNEPIVMDFGLARVSGQEVTPGNEGIVLHDGSGDVEQTQQGTIIGTPRYMSPEQARGRNAEVGPASDIFSLGTIFYEMLTGYPPFQGQSLTELLSQVISSEPSPPTALRPEVDPSLEAICLKMLAKRPQDRFASMRDVADAISEALKSPPPRGGTVVAPSGSSPEHPGHSGKATPVSPRARLAGLKKSWLIGVGLLAVIALAAIVVRLKTRDGTLVVTVDEPGAEVKVLSEEGAVEIVRRSDGSSLRIAVPPGEHRLSIEKDGFRVYAEQFEIAAGESTSIHAHLEPLPLAATKENATPADPVRPSPAPPRAIEKETQQEVALQQIAHWLLQTGADLEIQLSDGSRKRISQAGAVPSAGFKLIAIFWERKGALPAFGPQETARLARCVDVDKVSLQDQSVTSLDWLAAFPRLSSLRIWGGSVPESAVPSLGALKNLRALEFSAYPQGVTPAGLHFLRELTNLEDIYFNAVGVTNEGLAHLAGAKKLKRLVLWATGITDEGLVHLHDLEQLEVLRLGTNAITPSGLQGLGELPALKELQLYGCPFDDADLRELMNWPYAKQLTSLSIGGTKITSQGVESLVNASSLRTLWLDDTQIGDDALPFLTQLASLSFLDVRNTRLSPRGVAELRHALRDCRVNHNSYIPLQWHVKYFAWPDAGFQQPPQDWNAVIGSPPLAEADQEGLQHNWGSAAPHAKVPPDHFAIVATTEFDAGEGGEYALEVASDDGVRVSIDDEVVLDAWTWRQTIANRIERPLSAGRHTLKVEYFEIDGWASLAVQLMPNIPLPDLPSEWFGSEFLVSGGPGVSDVYLYNLETREWKNLTNHPAHDVSPAWSFDGEKIAFVSNRSGKHHFYTMDADGSSVMQAFPDESAYYSGAAWSPDGKHLAFYSIFNSKPAEAWIGELAGTHRIRLPERPIWDMAWSPQGERLAFAIRKDAGFRLATVNARGQDYQELSTRDNPYGFVNPHWSPDGKRLTYIDFIENRLCLCVVDADGGNRRIITQDPGCYTPAFSRDGARIFYQMRTDDRSPGRIFVVDADGENRREFAWPQGLNGIPRKPFAWRPAAAIRRNAPESSSARDASSKQLPPSEAG
jgi:tRNA A-37 threonylcarbamoyl transferase component Bud32